MCGSVITTSLKPAERGFLRRLAACNREFVLATGLAEKLAGAALVQAGYVSRHPIFANHFSINPAGEFYLARVARAH